MFVIQLCWWLPPEHILYLILVHTYISYMEDQTIELKTLELGNN